MLKGGALLNAIFFFIILSSIGGSLILLSYHKRVEFTQIEQKERLIDNAESGINYALGFPQKTPLNQEVIIDLFGLGKDSVELLKKPWGMFELLTSKAYTKKSSFTKVALIGSKHKKNYSIYLSDQNKPLSIAGKTIIKGSCFLPKSGIKRAYIEGQSFVGTSLVKGKIHESQPFLPGLNTSLIEHNSALLSHNVNSSAADELLFEDNDSISNDFQTTPLFFNFQTPLEIQNKVISGNVILRSDVSIFIRKNAELNNVLCYAPSIKVESGFEGTLQLFARDSILVASNTYLSYPSTIGLISDKSTKSGQIFVGQKTVINGAVFAYSNGNKKLNLEVNTEKSSVINGLIYCDGKLDHQGKVNGSIMCNSFILKTPSSIYENHLLNAVVDVSALPSGFIRPKLMSDDHANALVKWVE